MAIVATVGLTAGFGACAYGFSNMIEGSQEIYYGSKGDITTVSHNPLRDEVFNGNQEAYDKFGTVCLTVGSIAAPMVTVGMAASAALGATATSIAPAMAYEGIKAGTSIIISNYAADVGTEWGNTLVNEEWGWVFGLAAGTIAGIITYASLTKLDQTFNLSGMYGNRFQTDKSISELLDDDVADDMANASKDGLKIDDNQFGKKVGKHAQDYNLDPKDPLSRDIMHNKINDIFANADEVRCGNWRGIGGAKFYIKGNDVVVTDMEGNFVTILKDGIYNQRVINGVPI